MINIKHHGAVNGVTGSCHELTIGEGDNAQGILIDCGLFQGAETSGKGADHNSLEIDFPIDHIKALIVTHVHIDHVGRIPYLLAAGFKGPIYCTEASAQLLPLVLEDAVKIGFTRDKRIIRKFLKHLAARIKPIPYKQWQNVIDQGQGVDRKRIDVKFQPAGHILGSAYIETRSRWNEKKLSAQESNQSLKPNSSLSAKADNPVPLTDSLQLQTYSFPTSLLEERVLFSGDLGAPYAPLLPAPKSPYKTDVLVIESTYGDKNHQGRKERRQQLKAIIERSAENGGALLIPAFSIGRTQEILYEIESLIFEQKQERQKQELESYRIIGKAKNHNGSHPETQLGAAVPPITLKTSNSITLNLSQSLIVIDSPLAANFTQQYRSLKKFWDKEALARIKSGRHPLSFEQLHTVDSHTDHMKLVNHFSVIARRGATWQSSAPKANNLQLKTNSFPVILAASGMCAGGRITNYLKALIEDERTDILFVGYQASGTPGRDIQKYGNRDGSYVLLDGERFNINAKVHTIGGYSAHAGQKDLLNFIGRMRHKPKQVRVVHGDDEAKQALKQQIERLWPDIEVIIPGGVGAGL